MKVTKAMVHVDLRPKYASVSALPALLKRRWVTNAFTSLSNRFLRGKPIDGIDSSEINVPGSDGVAIRVRVNRPLDHVANAKNKLPLMLYIHGGGYIMGIPEIANAAIKRFIETRPCVVLAPDYRKAFDHPYPAGLNDCYDTILWARANADQLGIDPNKIIVAGHSGGGGLTAAVTLKARDTGDFDIAFQMPIYPMIDDQQPNDSERAIDCPAWNTEMNAIGWGAYLADLHAAGKEIPTHAAPIRNKDYTGFPPTITFVGTLEPFYWETVQYVGDLRSAGIEVAYKEYENCFHGFETIAGDTPIGKDGLDFTFSSYGDFYDRHISQQT